MRTSSSGAPAGLPKIFESCWDPPEGAPLWFAAAQIMQLCADHKWLSKATKALCLHIKEKNEKTRAKRGEPNPLVDFHHGEIATPRPDQPSRRSQQNRIEDLRS